MNAIQTQGNGEKIQGGAKDELDGTSSYIYWGCVGGVARTYEVLVD